MGSGGVHASLMEEQRPYRYRSDEEKARPEPSEAKDDRCPL